MYSRRPAQYATGGMSSGHYAMLKESSKMFVDDLRSLRNEKEQEARKIEALRSDQSEPVSTENVHSEASDHHFSLAVPAKDGDQIQRSSSIVQRQGLFDRCLAFFKVDIGLFETFGCIVVFSTQYNRVSQLLLFCGENYSGNLFQKLHPLFNRRQQIVLISPQM